MVILIFITFPFCICCLDPANEMNVENLNYSWNIPIIDYDINMEFEGFCYHGRQCIVFVDKEETYL